MNATEVEQKYSALGTNRWKKKTRTSGRTATTSSSPGDPTRSSRISASVASSSPRFGIRRTAVARKRNRPLKKDFEKKSLFNGLRSPTFTSSKQINHQSIGHGATPTNYGIPANINSVRVSFYSFKHFPISTHQPTTTRSRLRKRRKNKQMSGRIIMVFLFDLRRGRTIVLSSLKPTFTDLGITGKSNWNI